MAVKRRFEVRKEWCFWLCIRAECANCTKSGRFESSKSSKHISETNKIHILRRKALDQNAHFAYDKYARRPPEQPAWQRLLRK